MKSVGLSLICFVVGSCVLCGCRREAVISSDDNALTTSNSYILTVQEAYKTNSVNEAMASLITIRASYPATISIDWSGGKHRSEDLSPAFNRAVWEGWVELTANRHGYSGAKIAQIETFIDPYIAGKRESYVGVGDKVVSAETKLTNIFSTSIVSGTYKFGERIIIAHDRGEIVTMAVGKPAR